MIREVQAKSILNKKKKRDSWFLDDYTLNPFSGCSFNCQYCFVRGSKYGVNMEESLSVKTNAIELLDKQLALRARKNQYGIIALASATDPYLRIEEKLKITEGLLKVILKHRFPVLIITKSELILRDLSLLQEISEQALHAPDLREKLSQGVIISFSVSTLDERVAGFLEPGAPSPARRLETLQRCREAGLMAGLNAMPVLPFISDSDEALEEIVSQASQHKANYVMVGGLTLFGESAADSKVLYFKFLERHYPDLLPRYHEIYGNYNAPSWSYQNDLTRRASAVCQRYGMKQRII